MSPNDLNVFVMTFNRPAMLMFSCGRRQHGAGRDAFVCHLQAVRFLSNRFLMFLGEVSYSAYLLHIVFVILLRYRGSHWDSIVGTLLGFVVFTYALAYLSWRYLETPARKAIWNLFGKEGGVR